ERSARALAAIARSAVTQAKLIEDLLDVSRIVTGKLVLDVGPVDLTDVAEAALDAVRAAAEAKQIRLEQVFELTGKQVEGDPARLQQVVWNLLSNAVKFSVAGGRIVLRVSRAGAEAVVSVRDEGEGIETEFLPHVVAGGPSFKGGRAPAASTLRGVRVLVVDDDPDARESVAAVLEQAGATVQAVESVGDAVESLEREPSDVLVSDIAMPGVDGYTLLGRARARLRGREIPAAALTAYAASEDRRRALAAGFQAHLAKPVDPAQLVAVVAELAHVIPGGVPDSTEATLSAGVPLP